jgi:hypothetical protein
MAMEIRKFSDIIGVITTQTMVEGRCVLLTDAPAYTGVWGLHADVAGVKLPVNATEAGVAKYVVGWPMDNRPTPIIHPMDAYNYIVRNQGFEAGQRSPDSDTGTPMTGKTIYLTTPSVTENLTIPSGYKALAYGGGVFTFPSGSFVYSADLANVGARVTVESTAGDDRGKPKYSATGDFGVVEQWDATAFAVTIRTLQP